MKYKYIYVAGPITNGDTLLNIRKGMLVGLDLVRKGFVPFVPHNDMVQYLLDPITLTYDTMLAQDFSWIEKCDALLRIPGKSPGADREVSHAIEHGLLIINSIRQLEDANVGARGA